ncbi:MAG TPA: VCBS repeat-containing protein, partial [Candidatus Cloacimonetes bacterium]|nr:VCBS repeat-containing protein [Candidatus Cloacimonadota bacterium]
MLLIDLPVEFRLIRTNELLPHPKPGQGRTKRQLLTTCTGYLECHRVRCTKTIQRDEDHENMKYFYSALLLAVIFTGWAVTIPLSRGIFSIAIGDVDLNGLKDIVVGHIFYDTVDAPSFTVLYNYSNGSFAFADSTIMFGTMQGSIQLENMNDDAWPDIVCQYDINGVEQQFARVYFNQNGSFGTYIDYPFTGECHFNEIRTGDVNGDGYGDIIFYSWAWGYIWALVSDGPDQFLPLHEWELSFYPQDICVGDVDNDGDDEVIIAGLPLTIFDFTDSGWQQITLNNSPFHSKVKIGDADGDGVNEIFTLQIPPAGYVFPVRIYKFLDGQIELKYEDLNLLMGGLRVYDYNNDGLADYTLARHLFTNLGGYNFSESTLVFPQLGESSGVEIADMNNDGYLDLVFMCAQNGLAYLTILFGDGEGNFAHKPVAVPEEELPAPNTLTLKNYPNPFTTFTRFTIAGNSKHQMGEIVIYNIKGQLI